MVLAQAEGMDAKAFEGFDKLHFDNQRRQVERFIAGDAQGPVRDGMNERTIAEVGGHIERKIGAEADLLGIFPEHLTTMQGEAVTQIAYEFERAAETGRIDEMSYDPAQCFFIGAVDMLNELLPES
ncbi:hypothetical protein [Devosia sp.]|uniref:hypothetical protein n=1 Tax=Devosia sp. TaxID=1871048 RepID=UPI002AFE7C4C|nr:hypothetical protein [Devosia sp.]